jgi:quercetin dioxygenase-like cupin family protein
MNKVDVYAARGAFFKVLGGTENSQLAVMTIRPGQSSGGEEPHPGDQVVLIVEGRAEILLGQSTITVSAGEAAIIPAGMPHRIDNTSDADLFLFSVYAPPAY